MNIKLEAALEVIICLKYGDSPLKNIHANPIKTAKNLTESILHSAIEAPATTIQTFHVLRAYSNDIIG